MTKGIEENDVCSPMLTLTTMETKLKELGEDMMKKSDTKFSEAAQLFPPVDGK